MAGRGNLQIDLVEIGRFSALQSEDCQADSLQKLDNFLDVNPGAHSPGPSQALGQGRGLSSRQISAIYRRIEFVVYSYKQCADKHLERRANVFQ